jgi:hypothetical protein
LKYLKRPGSKVKKAGVPTDAKPKSLKRKRKRGVLPFARLPKAPCSREDFLEAWKEKSEKLRPYLPSMLDWGTGEVNWDCEEVYGFVRGTVEWMLYCALSLAPRTYDEVLALQYGDGTLKDQRKSVDYQLKRFITNPTYFPPGAGAYREDPETGKMWIERDPATALTETLPWRRDAG